MARYNVAPIDGDYCLFDTQVRTPKTYMLMVRRVQQGMMNRQLVLTSYDASEHVEHDYFVFAYELWSTFVFVGSNQAERFTVGEVIDQIQLLPNIDVPLELSYRFGGSVLNTKISLPTNSRSLI